MTKSTPKRTQSGVATTDVVQTAHVGDNADVFRQILDLYLDDGAKIADVTYGKGAFWRSVRPDRYECHFTDLKTGTDCRDLPYADASLDAVIFDPPYIEGFFRDNANLAGVGTHGSFRDAYSNGRTTCMGDFKYHDRVVALYVEAAIEAKRVIKDRQFYIVKCQDEVSANRQKLTHVEIIHAFDRLGFYCRDLFVVVRRNKAGVSRLVKQSHGRKNHSYFLVFQAFKTVSIPYSNFRGTVVDTVVEAAEKEAETRRLLAADNIAA